MSEISTSITPEIEKAASLEELFNQLLQLEPKLISNFVATNAAEQKELFLAGEVRNPDHVYGKLDTIDFEENRRKIRAIGDQIIAHPDVPSKYIEAYTQFVQNYEDKTTFMELAYRYKHANESEKESIESEYIQMNIELFGEPDELTYRSLLGERLAAIKGKELSEEDSIIRDELFALIDADSFEKTERFHPSDETVAWMHEVVESLFGTLLEHVPDKETFTAEDIKALFEELLVVEFGEVLRDEENGITEGWKVIIESAQKINVKSAEKEIVIPMDRELDIEELRDRIVHEIGVHFLRSVMGEQTDLLPFRLGLSDYLDTEEGLGSVTEQARINKYREAGLDHYITAGLSHFDKKDFRDIYEIKWRIDILTEVGGGPAVKTVKKSQDLAYVNTQRFFRGTDGLPWFKDLSYYNGAAEVWKHLEEIRGNDLELMLVFLGKGNPASPPHRHIMLETATV